MKFKSKITYENKKSGRKLKHDFEYSNEETNSGFFFKKLIVLITSFSFVKFVVEIIINLMNGSFYYLYNRFFILEGKYGFK